MFQGGHRFVVSLIASLSLVFTSLPASSTAREAYRESIKAPAARPESRPENLPENSPQDLEILEDIESSQSFESLENSNENAANLQNWAESRHQDLKPVFDLTEQLAIAYALLVEERGQEAANNMVDRGDLIVESEYGKAEYKWIGNALSDLSAYERKKISLQELRERQALVPRIVLNSNERAYLLLDSSRIRKDSKHLRRIIAKTHLESGSGRPQYDEMGNPKKWNLGIGKLTRKKYGRDLSLIWLESYDLKSLPDSVAKVEDLPKPRARQWSWWKEYFFSKVEKPTINHVTFGVANTVVQSGLAFGLTSLFLTSGGWLPIAWNAFFSLPIGVMIDTYRNWAQNSGGVLTKNLKRSSVSLTNTYGLILLSMQGDTPDKLSRLFMEPASLYLHANVLMSEFLLSRPIKNRWAEIMEIRDLSRRNIGTIDFRFLGQQVSWSRANFENQALYMIPWALGFIDTVTLAHGTAITVPGTHFALPLARLLGVPVAMAWSKWYARHLVKQTQNDPYLAARSKEFAALAEKYDDRLRVKSVVRRLAAPRSCSALFNKAL